MENTNTKFMVEIDGAIIASRDLEYPEMVRHELQMGFHYDVSERILCYYRVYCNMPYGKGNESYICENGLYNVTKAFCPAIKNESHYSQCFGEGEEVYMAFCECKEEVDNDTIEQLENEYYENM